MRPRLGEQASTASAVRLIRVVGAAAVLLASLGASVAVGVVLAAPASADEVCTIDDPRLTEMSGLATSIRHSDVVWTHNDSGDVPAIYAISTLTCDVLATVNLRGVSARDVEAIAEGRSADGTPMLWIGDIGDNQSSWPSVKIYSIAEPAHLQDQTVAARTYTFSYPDGPHNAETLLAAPTGGKLWVVTKSEPQGEIFSLKLGAQGDAVATKVGTAPGTVTDGSIAPDASQYILRGYFSATMFDGLPEGTDAGPVELPLQPQGEAVTWTQDGTGLYLVSEREGRLLRITVREPQPTESPTPSPTETTQSPAPSPTQSQTQVPSPTSTTNPTPGQSGDTWLWVAVIGGSILGVVLVATGSVLFLRERA